MSILLEIEKEYNKYMEEEDHFTLFYSTLLPALFVALAAAAMTARLLQLQLFLFSLFSRSLSQPFHFALNKYANFIGKYGQSWRGQ
jgi:hypothetical protein